jgi:hypothetical protein
VKPLVKQNSKTSKYVTYSAIAVFFAFVVGAVAFYFNYGLPTPSTPVWGPIGTLIGTFYVAFPWFNWVSLGGLVVLGGLAAFGYSMKEGNKNPAKCLLFALIIALLLTIFFGLSVTWATADSNNPPSNQLYPTYTPYPTYYSGSNPTASPSPTVDPNEFYITQRVTVEEVSSYAPTSFQPVIVDPYYGYTHGISVFGTYEYWDYDVYVQVGSDAAFWTYVASGVTDEYGQGAVYVPFFAADAGQVHTVVVVIDPDGGLPTSYGGFTAGELSALVSAGTLRESNHLSFEVVDIGIGEIL